MAEESLLASWNDTPNRQAVIDYVATVTGDGPAAVPPDERIATFDNDGTLWTEKPLPIELAFILERLAEMAEADDALRSRQPWRAAHDNDLAWLGDVMTKHYGGDDTDLKVLLGGVLQAFAGQTVDEYAVRAATFVDSGRHPTLGRLFNECAFVPMVELLRYLEANGFATFITSGGDRDFMRPFAGDLYGIPPERVIGSSNALRWDDSTGSLSYLAEPDVFDDGPTKPIRIWSRIGRRPVVAGGNSNGDIPMLAFAGGPHPALRLLVLHDDPEREAAYTTGAEQALERATAEGWTVISVKDDWSTVFADVT